MTTVFISYRRQDTDAFADAITEDLQRRLGKANVFLDVKGIAPGDDFEDVLMQRVRASTVALVLVGANWLDVRDSQGQRRLDNPKDWVRSELREALQQKKRIIPVLVRGARMPQRDELPEDIQAFAGCHAFTLTTLWLDLPRLGGVVDGRLSVAEPIVVMGIAAAYGYEARDVLRTMARSFQGVDAASDPTAVFASHYYGATGVSLYYAALVLGALVAIRARLGWRTEEILRIALCTAGGVAAGYLMSVVPIVVMTSGSHWRNGFVLALWFGGLAAGTLTGIRLFAPMHPIDTRAILALALGIAAAAFVGGWLQPTVTSGLASLIPSRFGEPKIAFWGTVLVAASVLWWRFERPRLDLSGKELMSVLGPLLLALLIVDVVNISTTYVLYAENQKELENNMINHRRHVDVIFFATLAGVSTWRINRLLRKRGAAVASIADRV